MKKRPKQYALDKILKQCSNRTSKSSTLTTKLTEEYLENIDYIMTLKQVEKDLIKWKAINFVETLRIINEIDTTTDELKNIEEFKELKENICKAHKYWGYLRGVPREGTKK